MAAIYDLSRAEIAQLLEDVTEAHTNNRQLRVMVDDGLMVKVGEEMWTLPFGTQAGSSS